MAKKKRQEAEPAVVSAMAAMGEAVGKAMAALDAAAGRTPKTPRRRRATASDRSASRRRKAR